MNKTANDLPDAAGNILAFWFTELTPEQWWRNADLDDVIRDRFQNIHAELAKGVPATWLETAEGTLAAVIALDQFPRNMYRGTPASFASDEQALQLAMDAIENGLDAQLNPQERMFLYMPFQHSECRPVQEISVKLFSELDEGTYKFAVQHKDIIDRFGRFPHRNEILGRQSTDEELAFLQQGSLFW